MLKTSAACLLLIPLGACVSAKSEPNQPPAASSAQMEVVPLKHAAAAEIATELTRLQKEVRIVADGRTNSVIVAADSSTDLARMLDLIADLDVDVTPPH